MSRQEPIADDTLAIGKALSRLRAQEKADIAECRRLAMAKENKKPTPPAKPKRTGNPVMDWRKRREHDVALVAFQKTQKEADANLYHARIQRKQSSVGEDVNRLVNEILEMWETALCGGKTPFGESIPVRSQHFPTITSEDCVTPPEKPFVWVVTDGRTQWRL